MGLPPGPSCGSVNLRVMTSGMSPTAFRHRSITSSSLALRTSERSRSTITVAMWDPDSWASSLRLYWTPTFRTRLRPSG